MSISSGDVVSAHVLQSFFNITKCSRGISKRSMLKSWIFCGLQKVVEQKKKHVFKACIESLWLPLPVTVLKLLVTSALHFVSFSKHNKTMKQKQITSCEVFLNHRLLNDCLKLLVMLETVLSYVSHFNRRDIQNMHFHFFIVKRKGKNIWRPEIDTWRPQILVKSPHGDHVKKLILDPVSKASLP